MATTFQADKHGPLHSKPDAPANAPLVFRIGDKASDDRFRALGLDTTSADPEGNLATIQSEARAVSFDRHGKLIKFSHFLGGSHGKLSRGVSTDSNGEGVAFVVIFSRPQLAEFLILTDGTPTTDNLGDKAFDFPDRVPLEIKQLINPYTEKKTDTLYLHPQANITTQEKVAQAFHGGTRHFLPEVRQLVILVCVVNVLRRLLKAILNQPGTPAAELAQTKADLQFLEIAISPSVGAIHDAITDPTLDDADRRQIIEFLGANTPLGEEHAAAALANKATPIDKPPAEA